MYGRSADRPIQIPGHREDGVANRLALQPPPRHAPQIFVVAIDRKSRGVVVRASVVRASRFLVSFCGAATGFCTISGSTVAAATSGCDGGGGTEGESA